MATTNVVKLRALADFRESHGQTTLLSHHTSFEWNLNGLRVPGLG